MQRCWPRLRFRFLPRQRQQQRALLSPAQRTPVSRQGRAPQRSGSALRRGSCSARRACESSLSKFVCFRHSSASTKPPLRPARSEGGAVEQELADQCYGTIFELLVLLTLCSLSRRVSQGRPRRLVLALCRLRRPRNLKTSRRRTATEAETGKVSQPRRRRERARSVKPRRNGPEAISRREGQGQRNGGSLRACKKTGRTRIANSYCV